MIRLEQGSNTLIYGEDRLEPISVDKNMVGFCPRCESELNSLAYHKSGKGWMVCAQCKNNHLVLMRYDQEWNWLDDQDLEISMDSMNIASLPREKLEAVFTNAEIRDMEAYQCGQPYTRQNLYRARAKFEKFEKLFGARIKL